MFFHFPILAFVSLATAQSCYWPSGDLAEGQTACPLQKGSSARSCCGTQTDGSPSLCLADGLCLSDLKVWRGGCTDKTWADSACSVVCPSDGPFQLSSCGNDPNGLLFGCYDCKTGNFSANSTAFNLSPAQKQILGLSSGSRPGSSTQTTTVTVTQSSSSQTSASVGTAPPVESEEPLIDSTTSSDNNNSTGIKAGLGAALGCALVAIGVLAFLLMKEKRIKNKSSTGMVAAAAVYTGNHTVEHAPPYKLTQQSTSNSGYQYPSPTIVGDPSYISNRDERCAVSLKHELGGAQYMTELEGGDAHARGMSRRF